MKPRRLEADPPQWISYQRQLNILKGSERLYNHGHRLPQQNLDAIIMQKLASGQRTLVDRSNYLNPSYLQDQTHVGWYVIRTRP